MKKFALAQPKQTIVWQEVTIQVHEDKRVVDWNLYKKQRDQELEKIRIRYVILKKKEDSC